MIKRILDSIVVCVLGSVFTLSAALADTDEPRLTVVELFTSQGCSSCPPADAVLKAMRDKPGVLTLSWPVDYWDRLGWEDTFAHPYNAKRQAAYNKRLGRGGVFTPQMVFDGRLQCIGSKKDLARENIEQARTIERVHVTPIMSLESDTLTVALPQEGLSDKLATVRVVWYLEDATVDIGDGENQGRSLHYTNVILGYEMLDDWDGSSKSIELDLARARELGASHAAILIQDEYSHGPIIGAASIELL